MCFRVRALAPTHRHGRAHPLPAPLPPSSALLPQALCYGADTLLFVTLHATDIDAHLSAAVIGALIIIAPTLMQHIAGRHVQGRRNAGRGMQVALLLGFLWLVMVVTLHSLKFPIGPALQLCSGYTIACLVVACLAIYRFLCTLLLVYAIYLGTAIGSLLLIYADYFQVGPVLTICGLTLAGFGLPPVLVSPLAKQYADLREERALSLLARSVQEREARDVEAKAVRPTRSKAKHALKAGRLASRGELLPQLSDLYPTSLITACWSVLVRHAGASAPRTAAPCCPSPPSCSWREAPSCIYSRRVASCCHPRARWTRSQSITRVCRRSASAQGGMPCMRAHVRVLHAVRRRYHACAQHITRTHVKHVHITPLPPAPSPPAAHSTIAAASVTSPPLPE